MNLLSWLMLLSAGGFGVSLFLRKLDIDHTMLIGSLVLVSFVLLVVSFVSLGYEGLIAFGNRYVRIVATELPKGRILLQLTVLNIVAFGLNILVSVGGIWGIYGYLAKVLKGGAVSTLTFSLGCLLLVVGHIGAI